MTDLPAVTRVADQFALDGVIESAAPFGRGHINETFLVTTAGTEYVVQRINRSIFSDPQMLAANVETVSSHLAGELVPEPIAARSGGWLVHDGDDAWRAWLRVAGAGPISAPTPTRAHSAGLLLGRFHARLADLAPGRVGEVLPGFHGPTRRLRLLQQAVTEDPHGRVAGMGPEIEAAFAASALAAIAEDLVARVPCRVAHNDAKLDNVLFSDDQAVCLIDLDTVMPTAWFWDVGDLVRTASTNAVEDEPQTGRAVVDPELHAAILFGYRSGLSEGATPTAAEEEALEVAGAIVTYEQAVRFLTDWIAGDVYYRTTRPGQNRDRARAQLGLLASMPGTVGT